MDFKFKENDVVTLRDDVYIGQKLNGISLIQGMYNALEGKELRVVDITYESEDNYYLLEGLPYWYGEDMIKLAKERPPKKYKDNMLAKLKTIIREDVTLGKITYLIAEPYVFASDDEGNLTASYCCEKDDFDEEIGVKVAGDKLRLYHAQKELEQKEVELKFAKARIEDIERRLDKYNE